MAKRTLESWLADLDTYAASHPSGAYEVYATQALFIEIWTGKGCIPDPEYNPLYVPEFRGLNQAMFEFDTAEMKRALNARMATSWVQV